MDVLARSSLVILGYQYFSQMNLRVDIVVIALPPRHRLLPVKRLQHLFYLFLQSLDQWGFVLHSDVSRFIQMVSLDRLSLPLSLKQAIEETRIGIL